MSLGIFLPSRLWIVDSVNNAVSVEMEGTYSSHRIFN